MELPPAVVVHGLPDALAALRQGRPVTLLSAPGAASFAGVLWWRALVEAARRAGPDAGMTDVLDCADAPGRAMAALREGQRLLVLDARAPGFAAVRDAAATLGATVLPERPAALDLAEPGAARQLRAWLAAGGNR